MIAMHYNPLRRKEIINLGYLFRVSKSEIGEQEAEFGGRDEAVS